MKSIHIASVVVAAVAAFKGFVGDAGDTVEDFELLPEPQKVNLLAGIDMLVADSDAGPDARHAAWMDEMIADGWTHGEVKDEEVKTDPRMVPFDLLPAEEQFKEVLVHAIVRKMSSGEMANDAAPVTQSAPVATKGHVSVKYIGNREEHHDNLYGTNLEWKPEQSHSVPAAIAEKMRGHTDTYEVGKAVSAPAEKNSGDPQQTEKLPIPLPHLEGMNKQELVTFAQQHYGEVLHPNMKEENMRKSIHAIIQARGR